jgi:hypothetical protein
VTRRAPAIRAHAVIAGDRARFASVVWHGDKHTPAAHAEIRAMRQPGTDHPHLRVVPEVGPVPTLDAPPLVAISALADVEIEIQPDDLPLRGNVSATEDPEADRRLEAEIAERLDRGDVWAWCQARVVARFAGHEGSSPWLGGCSYANERDFQAGGYFTDLRGEALEALLAELGVRVPA